MNAQPDEHRRRVDRWVIGIVIGAFVVLAFVACTVGSINSGNRDSDTEYEAIAQCEARIDGLLKAPSTASYQTEASPQSGSWIVTGSVDAENGFGATVRSNFQCTVTIDGDRATTKVDSFE